jgi:hypothetical protein
MLRPTLLLSLLLCLAAPMGGCAKTHAGDPAVAEGSVEGTRFEAPEGFAVRFPAGLPEPRRAQGNGVSADDYSYSTGRDGTICVVVVGPGEGLDPNNLDAFRDAIAMRGDTVESSEPTTLAGYPARVIKFRNRSKSGTQYYSRGVVLHDGRHAFFVAFSSTDPDARDSAAAEAFLQSLELQAAR